MLRQSSFLPRQFVALFVLGIGLPSCYAQPSAEPATESEAPADAPTTDDARSNSTLLTVGSPAPSLDIEHWISDRNGEFKPVSKFAQGKVYVVEFWATWCGPCVGSMPHLAETQSQFVDQGVQIVSVSDEDLATVKKFLKRPYQADGDEDEEDPADDENQGAASPTTYGELTSAYCLTCDPDGSTYRDYMEAAAQNGIPTCFIVGKTGQIEWIGHPMSMSKPLSSVVADRWDRDAYLAEFQREQKRDMLQMELSRKLGAAMGNGGEFDLDAVMHILDEARDDMRDDPQMLERLDRIAIQVQFSPIMQLMSNGNYDDAEVAWNKFAPTVSAEQQAGMENWRLQTLLAAQEYQRAANALGAYAKKKGAPAEALNALAWVVVESAEGEDELSADLLAAAVAAAEKALEANPDDPSTLDTLAHLAAAQGDLKRAIEIQEQAVSLDVDGNEQLRQYLEELRAR